MTDTTEITINGVNYIRKDAVADQPKLNNDKVVIIRSESAGCFFGELVSENIKDGVVELKNARRIWYWEGAASLSQLAVDGTVCPTKCKFPVAVPTITVAKVIEIIPVAETALNSLNSVPVWKR